jgi:hypothetical protein
MVSQTSVSELLNRVQQLSATDFDLFFEKVNKLRLVKTADLVAKKEQKLLQQINAHMPASIEHRFALLVAKRDLQMLTEAEYAELLQLTEKVEQFQTRRLKLLVELANLKGMTLPNVIEHYQLHPKPVN